MVLRRRTATRRQDSLHEQMLDLIRIAEREGMYDAADWIKGRWNMPRYWDETRALAAALREKANPS